MIFYIDPGTGSMLFTILIGVIGAAIYALRNSWVKLKVLLSGGKSRSRESSRIPFVFFTDSKRYWTIFKPLCDEMESAGKPCCTSQLPRTIPCWKKNMST